MRLALFELTGDRSALYPSVGARDQPGFCHAWHNHIPVICQGLRHTNLMNRSVTSEGPVENRTGSQWAIFLPAPKAVALARLSALLPAVRDRELGSAYWRAAPTRRPFSNLEVSL